MQEAATTPRPQIASCPHLAAKESAPDIMLWVVGALAPAAVWAVWNMGSTAGTVFIVSIVSCLGTEALWNYLAKRPQTLMDWSALVTAILLAMTLPPRTPWWMVLAGGVVAIGLGKMLFGGLGWNLFNPALVGRAMITISWAGVLAVQKVPGGWFQGIDVAETGGLDAINGATRLAIAAADRAAEGGYGFDLGAQFEPLLFRNLEGCIGEVSAALLILGGLVLILKGIIDWRIPAGYIGTVAVLSGLCGSQGFLDEAIFNVLAGGVLLGAFFMATDYVTSPMTKTGRLVFACGCGLINCVGRFYGPMPESTTFAILFMNGLVPLIDRSLRPRTYGWVSKRE
ncbi:MAG: RnfABCDGE type electron transport complex subunit D [Coriobacteriia bacterium]|nr:RnfABCDGE type electron transport complex subunit D [Coriobacteriia bacterium]